MFQIPPASQIWNDIKTALALLTRIPIHANFDRSAQAVWAFPLIGLLIGTLVAGVASIASWIGLNPMLSACAALTCSVFVTGAMHEDGIADSADGLWGGWDKARRLAIMRDSQIGTYGVLALILVFLLRTSALSSIIHAYDILIMIVAAHILSRACIPYVMTLLPHARADGLSVQTGRPSRKTASIGAALALGMSWFFIGFVPTIFAASLAAACTALVIGVAHRKIEGQTGDILGATQIVTELAILVLFAALI